MIQSNQPKIQSAIFFNFLIRYFRCGSKFGTIKCRKTDISEFLKFEIYIKKDELCNFLFSIFFSLGKNFTMEIAGILVFQIV